MSDIFISYARSDEAKARAIAQGLQRAGFRVWRDEQLPTHRAYYEVIEERLKAAAAVVVVWSKSAMDSQWVRAEADLGRSMNKLVQASVDGELPPMPFNQIQCARLKSWRGADDYPEWVKVLEGVRALAGEAAREAAAQPSPRPPGRRAWWIAGTAAALVALAALALVWTSRQGPAEEATSSRKIAVLPFRAAGTDPAEAAFAAALADDVAGDLSENALQTLPPSAVAAASGAERNRALRQQGVHFAASGTVRNEDGRLRVRAFLEDVDANATVWSQDFEEPASRSKTLRLAVSNAFSEAALAALEVLRQPGLRLDPETMALYIRGEYANATATSPFARVEAQRAYEAVVARAPHFGAAHAELAVALVGDPGAAYPPAVRDRARREAGTALKLAPRGAPQAFDVLYHLTRMEQPGDLARAEGFLRQGAEATPDFPFTWMRLCEVRIGAGLIAEAVDLCGRAQSLRRSAGPIGWRVGQVAYFAGNLDVARRTFRATVDRHPGYLRGRKQSFDFEALSGEPATALAILEDPDQAPNYSPAAQSGLKALLAARRAKTPAAFDAAAAALAKVYAAGELDPETYALYVAALGQSDQAFAALQRLTPEGASSGVLFHPALAGLRHDPRWWQEASRVGLISYWRKRGVWPDFCSAPGQAFDCKAAAAKAQPI